MTERVLRVALLGCGYIAPHHLLGYVESGRAEVVALIDLQPKNADSFAEHLPGNMPRPKVFTNLEQALAWNNFDAIDIMLPHDLHYDIATTCLRAGKHVLLEKPMAITLAQCKALVEEEKRCRQAGQVFMVAENAQYWPAVRKVKDVIESGRIGEVYLAKANYFESTTTSPEEKRWNDPKCWQFNPKHIGGGILMAGSCHWLRPLRMWLGEVDEVIGTTAKPVKMAYDGYESLAHAMLRFRSGVTATFHSLLADHALSPMPYFQVFGLKGEITVASSFENNEVTVYDTDHVEGESLGADNGYFQSISRTVIAFVEAVLDKKPIEADAEYCSGEPRIAWAIYRSVKSKKWEPVWQDVD